MRIRLPLFGVLALALMWAPAAAGQARDPAAADALFKQGRAAMESGDFKTACAKFYESNRLDPAIGTVFNIADCEEKQGHVATAWTRFQEVAQELPPSDERRPIALQHVSALDKRLPKLAVHLEGAPAGAVVHRDAIELGHASLDTMLPVDPGEHVVRVSAPGHQDAEFRVTLAEAEHRTLPVSVGAATATSTPGPAPGQTPGPDHGVGSGSGKRTAGYVVGAVGIAGVAVGAITGVMVLGKKSVVNDNCNAHKQCTQAGLDAASAGQTLGVVSTTGFIVGAVGVGIGTYLILSSDDKGEARSALVASPTPGGASVSWFRRF